MPHEERDQCFYVEQRADSQFSLAGMENLALLQMRKQGPRPGRSLFRIIIQPKRHANERTFVSRRYKSPFRVPFASGADALVCARARARRIKLVIARIDNRRVGPFGVAGRVNAKPKTDGEIASMQLG